MVWWETKNVNITNYLQNNPAPLILKRFSVQNNNRLIVLSCHQKYNQSECINLCDWWFSPKFLYQSSCHCCFEDTFVLLLDSLIHRFLCGEDFQQWPHDHRGWIQCILVCRRWGGHYCFSLTRRFWFITSLLLLLYTHTCTRTHTHAYTSQRFGALDPGRQVALFRITVCRLGELGEVEGGL